MSISEGARFSLALASVLSQINKENGYLTDIGHSVHAGFWAHVIRARSAPMPAIVIHPGAESPAGVSGSGLQSKITIKIPLIVVARLESDAGDFSIGADCMRDVRRAVYRNKELLEEVAQKGSVELGASLPDMSVDSVYRLFVTDVTSTIVENYEE